MASINEGFQILKEMEKRKERSYPRIGRRASQDIVVMAGAR